MAEVCRRLDGIPLAIELAAARAPALAIEQLAAQLDDALALLAVGGRTAPSRQQTLRATLDWSYDLLSGPERRLLGRLAAFAGGFALEAAEAVGARAGDDAPAGAVLDLLAALTDKSLVVVADQGVLPRRDTPGGEVRFRLLETVRQYGQERLEASGEARAIRDAHADYYLALAERAAPFLARAGQAEWLARLEREHDNLRAALRHALDRASLSGQAGELALRLGGALGRFWLIRGYLREGRQWLEAALAGGGPAAARAKALDAAGALARSQGDRARARSLSEESLALYRELGDARRAAAALQDLGQIELSLGNYARVSALVEESLALGGGANDAAGEATAAEMLGYAALFQGDYARAVAFGEESVARWRELGDTSRIAGALSKLGNVALFQGDPAGATARFEESLALYRGLDSARGIADAHSYLGWAAFFGGDYAQAAALGEESLALARELGEKEIVARSLTGLGFAALFRDDLAGATTRFREALALWRELGTEEFAGYCLLGLAGAAAAGGHPDRAARLLGAAEALREAVDAPLPPVARAQHERVVGIVRDHLDAATFMAAWEAGRAASEGVVAEALGQATGLAELPGVSERRHRSR